jgi:hypothetical protein
MACEGLLGYRAHMKRNHALPLAFGLLLLSSCSSLEFKRTGPDHGTFSSSATTFTLLSFDLPGPARDLAMGNVADSARPNLLIESDVVTPYLGWFDWILDFVGVRHARITGTWGSWPDETRGAVATPESNR